MMTLQWKKCAVLLGMAAVLAGCATHRVVEGDVRSFSKLPATASAQQPMTYRLERLPSQQRGLPRPQGRDLAVVNLATADDRTR